MKIEVVQIESLEPVIVLSERLRPIKVYRLEVHSGNMSARLVKADVELYEKVRARLRGS